MTKGKFIVFEGCDRSGKTTQQSFLFTYLSELGITCSKLAFPFYGTPTGRLIKENLHSGTMSPIAMQLLCVANRNELQQTIQDLLDAGMWVLCDRYKLSGLAYGVACGLEKGWLETCESVNTLEPDITIYLDVKPSTASARADFGRGGIYENVSFQEKVHEAYLELASSEGVVTLDANKPIGDIQSKIAGTVKSLLPSAGGSV